MKKLIVLILLLVPLYTYSAPSSVKLFVQWAQSSPNDWTLIDSSVWTNQPTKQDPSDVLSDGTIVGDPLLNNQKGYIFSLNVQGVTFSWSDHYAVINDPNFIKVIAWRDDPVLFPVGHRQAYIGIFKPLKWDANVGQNNTDQTFVWYREGDEYTNLVGHVPTGVTLEQYSNFVPPSLSDTKPGIYLSDSKWQEHLDAQTLKGWRD